MSPFPFLFVPVLAQNEILKNMKLADLFFLSSCSKRTHTAVKTATKYLPHLLISITFNSDYSSLINLKSANGDRMSFNVDQIFWMKTSYCSLPRYEVGNLKGILIEGVWHADAKSGLGDVELEDLVRYILDIFTKKKLEVTLRISDIKDFRLWNVTKSVDVLRIETEMSESDRKFVEEELEVAEIIDPLTPPIFHHPLLTPFVQMNL